MKNRKQIRTERNTNLDSWLRHSTVIASVVVSGCFTLSTTPAHAQHFEDTKLTAFDGGGYDNFGKDVAVQDDVAVIGSPYDDATGGTDSGSAYIYRREGPDWVYHQKIEPGDPEGGAYFGYSVEIIDDMIIVGAVSYENRGMAFVFRYDSYTDSWLEEDQLRPVDNVGSDGFGSCISASGRYMAIGAWMDSDVATDAGSVYIYEYEDSIQTWVELTEFYASDGSEQEWFGERLDMDGDYVVVGLYKDDPNGYRSGSAYIFQRSGGYWLERKKLIPADGAEDSYYGSDVAVSRDTVLVGAEADWDGTKRSGSAYVYTGSGTSWTLQQKLTDPDGNHWDYFGRGVDLDGDTALIGARYHDIDGDAYGTGAVYIYTRSGSTWPMQPKLFDSEGANGNYFGILVYLSGVTAVVGSPSDSWNGTNTGSACAFNDVLFNLYAEPEPLEAGQDATFSVTGGAAYTNTYLAYSLGGLGSTYVSQLNVTLNLRNPTQAGATKQTDSQGAVSWVEGIPSAGAGHDVWLQVVQYEAKTNVVATSIE